MSTGRIQFAEQDGTFVLKFVGEVRLTLCSALDATIEKIFTAMNFNAIVIDLTETRSIDSTTLGLLAKLSRRFGEGVINGALTARVGVAAMEVCRPLPFRALRRPRVTNLISRGLQGLFQRAEAGDAADKGANS